MNLGLEKKVALVLASSKGLGFACAKGLYIEGAHVVICSRSEENLIIAKQKIENPKNKGKRVNTKLTEMFILSIISSMQQF